MPINKVDLDQLLNTARVTLVGASDAGMRNALYDVMSEFLNDSSIWTQDITLVVQTDVLTYPLFVSEGQIIRLVQVANYGTAVPDANTPQNFTFEAALMPEIGTLVLKNSPNSTCYLLATVVTNVKLPLDKNMLPQAPDWLLPIWHVGLLDGLLGRMMLQPDKSYSSSKLGEYHLRRFRDAVGRARTSKLRANTNGAAAWTFPQQFRSSSQIGGRSERSF